MSDRTVPGKVGDYRSRMEALGLEAVIQLARLGDVAASGEIYRRSVRRVFGLCRHMLSSPEEAEDATSEVFLRLPKGITTYDGSAPFIHWLLSIASHHCVDILRKRRLEGKLFVEEETELPEVPASTASPLSMAMAEERGEELRQAIAHLPDNYRVPLVLRYYSDLSYDEIAHQLSLTRNHVATLIFRAKRELRQALAAEKKELKK
jgi:RNA polymerase sigma-70 factor (ECF subfamily)